MGEYLMKNNGVQLKGKCVGFFVFLFFKFKAVQHWNELCTVSGYYITINVQAKFDLSP